MENAAVQAPQAQAPQALPPVTLHEHYIKAIVQLVIARLPESVGRERLANAKIVYGTGSGEYRGITYYDAWQNGASHDWIEIAATGEESDVQVAGTTIHECAHVFAPRGAGHGKDWKASALACGLLDAMAAGQAYKADDFDPALWAQIVELAKPTDGRPKFGLVGAAPFMGLPPSLTFPPCPMGVGTRGGKSRGPGSGSRLRLWICECPKPVKVRVSSDDFLAHCDTCGSAFKRSTNGKGSV